MAKRAPATQRTRASKKQAEPAPALPDPVELDPIVLEPMEAPAPVKPMLVDDLDDEQKGMIRHALTLARQGPTVLHRRGGRAPVRWKEPLHISFEHPDHGTMQVSVAEEAIYKEDLPEEEKERRRAAARLMKR